MAAAITFLSTLMWLFLPLDGEVWTDTARSGYRQLCCVYSFIISLLCPSYPTLFCIRHECALSVLWKLSSQTFLNFGKAITGWVLLPTGGKKQNKEGNPSWTELIFHLGWKRLWNRKIFPATKSSQSPSDSLGCLETAIVFAEISF